MLVWPHISVGVLQITRLKKELIQTKPGETEGKLTFKPAAR